MKLSYLHVRNYRCIEDLELKPGAVTVFEGTNGVGKSSAVMAIQEVFDGGHHPSRIRDRAKTAEITLHIEDKASTIVVEKVIRARTSAVTIKRDDGEPFKAPQTFLNELAGGISFDPIRFVTDKKERMKFLEQALSIRVTLDELLKHCLTGRCKTLVKERFPGEAVDLDGLKEFHEALYKERTEENGRVKQLTGSVKTLKESVEPAGDAFSWKAKLEVVNAELTAIGSNKLNALREIDNDEKSKLNELQIEAQRQIEEIKAKLDFDQLQLSTRARELRVEVEAGFADKLAAVRDERTIAQERLAQTERAAALVAELERNREQLKERENRAGDLSDALEAIADTRKAKLSEVPVDGAEVRDGELYIGDRLFDDLNTAKQYEKAFEFAALLPNPLGLMICDRAETFENGPFEEFKQAAAASGFQIFMARVTPKQELTVQTLGDAA